MYIGLLRDSRVAEVVKHGVREGRSLCGFTDNLPHDWPRGHEPVPFFRPEEITCPMCQKFARELSAF